MKDISRLLSVVLIALVLDGLTKRWAEQALVFRVARSVFGQYFQLTLDYNTGVAFGLFANGGGWLLVLTSLLIGSLVIWLVNALRTRQLPAVAAWPAGMILGGAIANFVDRLADSRVTDFLDVGIESTRFPTFNIADSCLVVGVGFLMVTILLHTDAAEVHYGQNHPNP